MKKRILLGLFVCASHTLCHSQSNTTQLPNGVIVHQALGVEGAVEPKIIEPVKARTKEDWTLAQCIDALSQISMKLNESSPSDKEYYMLEKERLIKRINELKSAN